ELYLNGALIGFQRRDDGRYEFRDVPVLYGLNVFRLVFHGPRGERRQRIETYHIGETLTPAGELQYRVGHASPEAQADRSVAEVAYGLTRRLTLAASAARLDGERYAIAGLRMSFGRLFTYGDAGGSAGGGRIARAGLQTRLGGVAVTFTRAQLANGYVSETYPSLPGFIASRTTLRLGGAIAQRVPLSIDVQRDELTDGGSVVRATSLLSMSIRQTWISHRMEALLVRDVLPPLAGEHSVGGALLVSRSLHGVIVRGELGYEVLPRRRTTVMSLLAELPRLRRVQLSGELSYNAASRISRAIGRIRRDQGRVGVTLAVEVPSRGTPAVQLELSTSLIPNPLTRRIALHARPAASSGAVTAHVFLDRNGNGTRDDGEPPIEHAGFFVNRNSVAPHTNAGGIAMLDYLPVHAPTDVRISTSTLEDPWWLPSRPAVRMIPRPGKALVVDFPVAVAGEITGTVTLAGRPAGRVRVQLVDDAGKVASEATSEYDGFYDVTKIPPGSYTLRVHPEDVTAMGLAGDAARRVTITVEKNVLDGIDVALQRSIKN
ncbi:MAG TPA: carboxypeptidase-like regulatory domain-containing protein, partial [Thermoanaerobaculia bacterium]